MAIASRAHAPTGGGTTHGFDTRLLWEFLLVGFAGLLVLWIPVAAWVFLASRGGLATPGGAGKRASPVRVALGLGIVALIFLLAAKRLSDSHHGSNGAHAPGTGAGGGNKPNPPIPFDWAPAIAVLSVAVVGSAVIAYFLFRRQPAGPSRADLAARLSAVLDDSLDDLRAERDARRAVIATYARMEQALAGAGLPRAPAEAPLEYLGRVLRDLLETSAGAVARLTALFERAKFSRHEIDGAMKDEAIEALVAVRDELRMAAAS